MSLRAVISSVHQPGNTTKAPTVDIAFATSTV